MRLGMSSVPFVSMKRLRSESKAVPPAIDVIPTFLRFAHLLVANRPIPPQG